MSNFRIQRFQEEYSKEWNRFVKSHKNATVFHTIEWKKVLEDTFGYKPEYLMVEDLEGRIVGISPAFSVRTLFGRSIVSQPFFEYGGPIVDEGFDNAFVDILKFYRYKVEKDGIKNVEIRPLPDSMNIHPYLDKAGFVKQFKAYDFYIDIEGKDFEKDIWLGLYTKKSRVRNSVKKAIKSGVSIVVDDDVNTYYSLYIKTMNKLGSPPYPRVLFENINKYVGASVRFTYAYINGTSIAAMMSFPFNNRNLMVGLVSDENYQECRATDLLYNEQIEYSTKNNYYVVDFGRTRPNSSYEQYKRKWNAKQIDLYSYVFPPSASTDVNPYKYYLTFSKITKKIPWILTRTCIGPYLVKRFP